jgi:hypothetical protein
MNALLWIKVFIRTNQTKYLRLVDASDDSNPPVKSGGAAKTVSEYCWEVIILGTLLANVYDSFKVSVLDSVF